MRVAIIDYGASNLRSVQKAFEHLGAEVIVTSSNDDVLKADKLILPGNGAFGDCMQALNSMNLIEVIDNFIKTGKSFLGICVGMQLLFEKSFEFGEHKGLGYIKSDIVRFSDDILLNGDKIPHTGWNSVNIKGSHKLFEGIDNDSYFYFVHSYIAKNSKYAIGECTHGETFVATVAKENIIGVQFHPEKSQKDGLKLLSNFLSL